VRRNVPVVESTTRPLFTDIDVLGVRLDEEFNASYLVCECKSGITDGTRERLFWLSGVMKYFGAGKGFFIRSQMMPRKYSELADRLGIIAIPADQITELEKSYAIDPRMYVGPFCKEHQKAETTLNSLRQYSRETYEYVRIEYWSDPPHLQTFSLIAKCRDLLLVQNVDEESRMFHLAYIFSMLSLAVVRFARQVLFMPSSEREEVISLGLLGGRTSYLEKKELMRSFYGFMVAEVEKKYRSKYPVPERTFIENLVPRYTKYLVDLILRLCKEPRVASLVPRMMDLLAYESVLKDAAVSGKDVVGMVGGVRIDDVVRLTKDFLVFAQRGGITNPYVEHVFEEALKRIGP
jgi:hypothetical protein